MMRHFLIALLFFSGAAGASDVVSIFGLPLGGKPKPAFRVCKHSEIGSNDRLCLLEKPSVIKGGWQSGILNVPQTSLPKWASSRTLRLTLSLDGVITGIAVEPHGGDQSMYEIIESISARFGNPTAAGTKKYIYQTAEWDLGSSYIEVVKTDDKCCSTTFRTKKGDQAVMEYMKRKEIARPASP